MSTGLSGALEAGVSLALNLRCSAWGAGVPSAHPDAIGEVTMTKPAEFPNPFGFLMPGLDAMRQWTGMGAAPATPPGWVAPTMSVEDLDKRIQELKTVQYWLEQNARMIGATVQALEVQKMTLSTLKSMNVHADELAKALRVQPQDLMAAWAPKAASMAAPVPEAEKDLPREEPFDAPPEAPASQAEAAQQEGAAQAGVDPVQWWGALNEQFQNIASSAARDWQHHAQRAQAQMAATQAQTAAAAGAKSATASAGVKPPARKAAGRKSAVRKTAPRSASRGPNRS